MIKTNTRDFLRLLRDPFLLLPLTFLLALILMACPGKLAPSVKQTDNTTVSEIAEGVASGVVNATAANGTEALYIPRSPKAQSIAQLIKNYILSQANASISQGQCSTPQGVVPTNIPNVACTASNTTPVPQVLNLSWGPCNLGQPFATWSGGEILTITATAGTTYTCGVTPTYQNGDVVTRVFYSPSSRTGNFPNPLPLVTPYPNATTVLVDTQAGYLNSQGVPNSQWPTSVASGWANPVDTLGETITFTGVVARNIDVVGLHLEAQLGGYVVWNYTVSTKLNYNHNGFVAAGAQLAVNPANTLTTGNLIIQDNLNLITYQSSYTNLQWSTGCGVPISGTITTSRVEPSGGPVVTYTASGTCGVATIGGVSTNLVHVF